MKTNTPHNAMVINHVLAAFAQIQKYEMQDSVYVKDLAGSAYFTLARDLANYDAFEFKSALSGIKQFRVKTRKIPFLKLRSLIYEDLDDKRAAVAFLDEDEWYGFSRIMLSNAATHSMWLLKNKILKAAYGL